MKTILFILCIVGLGCATLPPIADHAVTPAAVSKFTAAVNSANFLIPLSILGVAAGVTVLFLGLPKIGIPTVLGSLTALVLTLVTNRYAYLLAAAGILVVVGVVITVIVLQYRRIKTALAEVVKGVQAVKSMASSPTPEQINTVLQGEQSSATEKLVQEVKAGLGT
jgi:hypothetical protein